MEVLVDVNPPLVAGGEPVREPEPGRTDRWGSPGRW
jgi:hypothetical protein